DLLHSTGFEGYLKASGQPFQSFVEKCECRQSVIELVTSEQKVCTLRAYKMDTVKKKEIQDGGAHKEGKLLQVGRCLNP
ncbi:hypothetical protein QTP86_017367, partial [Hemibagrus guttatus]